MEQLRKENIDIYRNTKILKTSLCPKCQQPKVKDKIRKCF